MLRRMKPEGEIEFFDSSVPYELKPLEVDQLDEKSKSSYDALLAVVNKLDKARPGELFESYKKKKKWFENVN